MSYLELARLLPHSLNLVRPESSVAYSLLSAAADQLSPKRLVEAVSPYEPIGTKSCPVHSSDIAALTEELSLNHDALFYIEESVSYRDFIIPAVPVYGASRTACDATTRLLAAAYRLQDLLYLKGVVCTARAEYDSVASTIVTLFRFGDMLCSGVGDLRWYGSGTRSTRFARRQIRNLLMTDISVEIIQRMLDAIGDQGTRVAGYLQAMLSDFVRDVLVTFAECEKQLQFSKGVYEAFSFPLFDQLCLEPSTEEQIPSMQRKDARNWLSPTHLGEMRVTLLKILGSRSNATPPCSVYRQRLPKSKIDAIVTVLEKCKTCFSATDTVICLGRSFDAWREAFSGSLQSKMSLTEPNCRDDSLWPEDFQLTAYYAIAPPDYLVSRTAGELVTLENALGVLLLRDIVRVANATAQRLIVVPWRNALEDEVARLLLGVRLFQKRHRCRPTSVDELLDEGILTQQPIDRLTGVALQLSPTADQILGPSLDIVRKFAFYPADAPKLEWAVPEISH